MNWISRQLDYTGLLTTRQSPTGHPQDGATARCDYCATGRLLDGIFVSDLLSPLVGGGLWQPTARKKSRRFPMLTPAGCLTRGRNSNVRPSPDSRP